MTTAKTIRAEELLTALRRHGRTRLPITPDVDLAARHLVALGEARTFHDGPDLWLELADPEALVADLDGQLALAEPAAPAPRQLELIGVVA